ncbi:hypothetical protein Tco_0507859 [Tanacetum coccineum]
MKAITTRSGDAYEGTLDSLLILLLKGSRTRNRGDKDKEQTNFQGSTAQIPPPVIPISIPESDVPKTLPKATPIPESDIPKSLPKPNIPYPSRFADALLLMPRFAPTIKSLLMNKEKLFELAKIPLNENCLAMLLKSFSKSLGLLGFPNSLGGHSTPTSEPFTSEFILEEIEAYLKDDSILPEIDHAKLPQFKYPHHQTIHPIIISIFEQTQISSSEDCNWHWHCVPKKGGITVVANEENELIPTRLVTGWRVCIEYRKLNEATRKDHFPLPFMDQMLERLAKNEFYCFLDGFLGYFQIPIDPQDQEKTTFTCPYGTFARELRSTCAKVDVIAKLPLPDTLKVFRSFLGHEDFTSIYKAYWALKHANFDLKTAGDHRKLQLNELNELRDQAYENSLIYKERTKKLHDSKIKNRIFNVGDRVLLFNSRLKIFSGKLKTRWSGPFTITKLFNYGTIELSQPDGPNFKVNGHRVKHYFGGDLPPKVVQDLHTLSKDE